MKIRALFFLYSLFLLVAGCCHGPNCTGNGLFSKQPPTDPASTKLAEAATSVSESLTELAAIERANSKKPTLPPPPNPAHLGMQGRVSIDWNGPIAPLVRKLAIASHYHVRILGREPAIPVIVRVNVINVTIADVLRDISYQAERQTDLVIYPSRRIIELRYLPR